MERIQPLSLCGPRAYFTDIDYKIVKYKKDKISYRKEVERRLKLLLLTKSFVVCAASHLTHEFAFNLFRENPILLSEGMIIPALRNDIEHITDYFETNTPGQHKIVHNIGIKKPLKDSMKDFYKEHISNIVEWELIDNSGWFRNNLTKSLIDKNSVLRRNLPRKIITKLNPLVKQIQNEDILTREIILKNISNWSKSDQIRLLDYVNLIYHMSGARAVNCESAVPQENYIDFTIADFSKHRSSLSDPEIFFKLFFEVAYESLNTNTLSINDIDRLSFVDIFHLRNVIRDSSFCEKYDDLIQRCFNAANHYQTNPQETINGLNESLIIMKDVTDKFNEVFKQERLDYFRKKHEEGLSALWKSTLSLGLSITDLIPFKELIPVIGQVSIVPKIIETRRALLELIVNVRTCFRSKKEIDCHKLYLKNKERLLHEMISKHRISEANEFHDTLELLSDVISEKIKL